MSPRVLVAVLVLGIVLPAAASAATPAVDARVLWIRGERVYVASTGEAFMTGDRVTFIDRKKTLAAGVVSQSLDDGVAVVTVVTGSLAQTKKLDRIRIETERPPQPTQPMLRVGIPSSKRPSLVFTCESAAIRVPFDAGTYRADTLGERSWRWVRDSASVAGTPWPDTLMVRAFDVAADEEIALERGELDVAVFWPGEASTRIRELPRWQGHPFGTRARGAIVAIDSMGGAWPATADSQLMTLNEQLFRGDLARLSAPRGAEPAAGVSFEVDATWPGRRAAQRILSRERATPGTRTVRLIYVDRAADDPSLQANTTVLFRIRCPVMCEPRLLPYVSALGPDAFANLLECR